MPVYFYFKKFYKLKVLYVKFGDKDLNFPSYLYVRNSISIFTSTFIRNCENNTNQTKLKNILRKLTKHTKRSNTISHSMDPEKFLAIKNQVGIYFVFSLDRSNMNKYKQIKPFICHVLYLLLIYHMPRTSTK